MGNPEEIATGWLLFLCELVPSVGGLDLNLTR